ncbi:lysylphosphatidylglycerol synthase domain-containing protein [Azorhizophilus paspali]|uniref:Lysylphosphatidylglycerol synthase domain-containing protein n=1 Tax=Azorhizophilus paspali TaxID=69963 RepID=A0ABV6SHU3_AZOPA
MKAGLGAWTRGHWPPIRRLLIWVFFILMVGLLFGLARKVEWRNVFTTLADYRPGTLLSALAIAAASHLLYACFDLLGRRYAHHHLPTGQVLAVTFVCYAFNLNLGAWIGGLALRYRLYSRLGLSAVQITQVYSLSLTTNWIAYLLLAGLVFAAGAVRPPAHWALDHDNLRLLGVLLLALVGLYLTLCAFSRRRVLSLRGHSLGLPSLRLALWQLVLGVGNWLLMALVIHVLLLQQVGYGTVLGTLLIASIASVLTHIPAGLGVLETVFVALLHQQAERDSVLAALLGYRAIYYLLPLLVASLVYLGLEARAKRTRTRTRT